MIEYRLTYIKELSCQKKKMVRRNDFDDIEKHLIQKLNAYGATPSLLPVCDLLIIREFYHLHCELLQCTQLLYSGLTTYWINTILLYISTFMDNQINRYKNLRTLFVLDFISSFEKTLILS